MQLCVCVCVCVSKRGTNGQEKEGIKNPGNGSTKALAMMRHWNEGTSDFESTMSCDDKFWGVARAMGSRVK